MLHKGKDILNLHSYNKEETTMLFKRNQLKDERLEKESSKLMVPVFFSLEIGIFIIFLLKLLNREPFLLYLLDVLCLFVGFSYVFFNMIRKGTLFVKNKDEVIKDINRTIIARAGKYVFSILIFGELFVWFYILKYMSHKQLWIWLYMLVWVLPAAYFTISSIKRGIIVWGTQKQKSTGKKQFGRKVVIGSLFYGIIMGFEKIYHHGSFHIEGILYILIWAVAWGIPFYLLMLGLISLSEKHAKKKYEQDIQEDEDEE